MIAQAISRMFTPRSEGLGSYGPTHDFWYTQSSALAGGSDTALQIGTAFACIRVRSNTVGALPWHIFTSGEDGRSEKAPDHPWYKTLHNRPNVWQTPFEYRSMMMCHLDLRGNSYSRIDPPGVWQRWPSLVPLNPDRMKVTQLDGSLRMQYEYRYANGELVTYSQDQILHVRNISFDGLVGVTPLTYARETTGLSVEQSGHARKLFQKGGFFKYFLKSPNRFQDDNARSNFRKLWSESTQAGNVPILEGDMDIKTLGMSMVDAQWIESRKFTGVEICQFLGCPPHLVFIADDTKSNMEQRGLEFLTIHLNPDLVRIEQAIQPQIGPDYFAQFNRDSIVRADLKTRYEAHTMAVGGPFKTPNEARALEDLPPSDSEGADDLRPPPNKSIPAGNTQGQKYNQPDGDETDDEERAKMQSVLQAMVADAAERIVSAEIRGLESRADKASGDRTRWDEWAGGWYAKHCESMVRTLTPLLNGQAETLADRWCVDAMNELTGRDVPHLLAEWKTTKAAELAARIGEALCTQ